MALLSDIQESLLTEGSNIGTALLKLRFMASRLGSDVLEDWVRHEAEGYPQDTPVPPYRLAELAFSGTFVNIVQEISNAPIPNYIVKKHAGAPWDPYEIRESVAVIESMLSTKPHEASFGVNSSNLLLLLQGNVYPNYTCISVKALLNYNALKRIESAVRAKVLDFTLELEKRVPEAAEITVGGKTPALDVSKREIVRQITNNIFQAPVTTISNTGQFGAVTVNVVIGNVETFVAQLIASGIPETDAKELGSIIRDEQPESAQQPFGQRARKWLGGKLGTASDTAWGMGKSVATSIITEALKKYYGL